MKKLQVFLGILLCILGFELCMIVPPEDYKVIALIALTGPGPISSVFCLIPFIMIASGVIIIITGFS